MIKPGEDILAEDFTIVAEAGEDLSTRDSVYISAADGKAYKTDADDLAKLGHVGFVIEGVTTGNNVMIRHDNKMGGFSGLTIGAIYYVSGTAGAITATKPTNFKMVGIAISATEIKMSDELTKRTRVYTANTRKGDSTTQFDITNTAGNTYRYTWDATGTDPSISAGTMPIGTVVEIQGQNFNAANNGQFVVTGVGANYFEVTNASGVVESNKTLGTGYLVLGHLWTKPGGLRYIDVEMVAGGGGGGTGDDSAGGGGGGGGYTRKRIYAGDLGATENITVGVFGLGATNGTGGTGGISRFGSHCSATGGIGGFEDAGGGGAGGVGVGGDFNSYGGGATGGDVWNNNGLGGMTGGAGGSSYFGGGAPSVGATSAGITASDYGGGGGGGCSGKSQSRQNGGNGANGVVIVTEHY